MIQKWINLVNGVPIRSDFSSTTGYGTPVCIDQNTGKSYFLGPSNVIYPLATGTGPIVPQLFGAVGDGVTDDSAAFVAAIAYLKSIAVNDDAGLYKGSSELFVPAGHYYLGTTTLDITHTLRIRGEGVGQTGGYATKLRWAAGATGIRIQAHNTTGASGTDGPHYSGSGTMLIGLMLQGGYAGTEAEFHGIHLRARAVIEDCFIYNFQGDGVYSIATAAGGGASEGNANSSCINRCKIQACRRGLYLDGADTNVWLISLVDFTANRTWGVEDSSFLGNNYVGCHSAANGWDGAVGSTPTGCTYLGNRYSVKVGQAVGASTNAPSGTTADNTWWLFTMAGGTYNGVVAWVSGTTFREGGAYKTDNANARNFFCGCYSESDQNVTQTVTPTMFVSGLHGAVRKGTGAPIDAGVAGDIRIPILDTTTSLKISGNTVQNGELSTTTNYTENTYSLSGATIQYFSAANAYQGSALWNNFYSGIQHPTEIRFLIGGFGAGVVITTIDSTGVVLAAGKHLFTSDEVYGAGWNGSVKVPTQNAVYDKINIGLTAAELTANSGGGTINFLRADGTWIAPSAGSNVYEAGPPGTVPTVASFTWVNQGTTTATDTASGILFANDVDGEVHMLVAAAPATPFNVYMRIDAYQLSTGAVTADIFDDFGFILRDSVNGDFIHCCFRNRRLGTGDEQTLYEIQINRWTNPTTFSANVTDKFMLRPLNWVRVNVTSTAITLYISNNGYNWVQVATETIATFVGTVDQYGIGIRSSGTTESSILASYFSTTAPI